MAPGAFACMGLLELAELAPEFDRWGMVTDTDGNSQDRTEYDFAVL